MPAPKTFGSFDAYYTELRQASNGFNENNDCAVIAVAAACDVSYETAHAAIAKHGRKPRHGTYSWMSHAAIRDLGFEMIPVPCQSMLDKYPGRHKFGKKSVTTHQPELFNEVWADGQTYILHVRAHILCVKNGKVVDWTKGKAKRVQSMWKVVKKAA